MKDLFEFILSNVKRSKISKKNKQLIIGEINKLQAFVLDARPARIAIVGRRGAGKSSLINAIFGELRAEVGDTKSQTGIGTWYSFINDLGGIDILDTRGLGEGTSPTEAVQTKSPMEEITQAIREKCPDVMLFLCKAKEVDARLDEDLRQLLKVKQTVLELHAYDVPIVGIVTQVDELAPLSDVEPPFNHPQKLANISETVNLLEKRIAEVISSPVKVIPVSAYLEFEKGKIVFDRRWNIDVLLEYLMTELPREAQVILAKLAKVKTVQKKLSRKIARSVMGITGLIGASPIPIADMPVITGLQLSMIGTIAMIGGHKLERKSIIQFVTAMGVNVGTGFALREVARQLVKVIPGAGNIISGTIATAGTFALSEAAIAYFIEHKSETEAKQIFEQEMKKNQHYDDM